MSEKERICPKCGRSDLLSWIRVWNVKKGGLSVPMHVSCAAELLEDEIKQVEQEKVVN